MFQLNARMDLHDLKSTIARNEYLLCLAAVNAHLNRYYTKDAPELIKVSLSRIYLGFISTPVYVII